VRLNRSGSIKYSQGKGASQSQGVRQLAGRLSRI
jgi:hypothetical protein